jgi:hypothetical protein
MATMSASQRGAIVGGAWLVGLGAVFLIQQAMGLPWSQAWPLFIIMGGIGTGISALAGLLGRRQSAWAIAWALAFPALAIVIGALLFVDLAGIADIDAFELLARWWPLALIVLGVLVLLGSVMPRARGVDERLTIPAAGASTGEVTLKFGAGRLDVTRGTPGILVDGTFEGGVRRRDLGPGRVELETDAAAWTWPGQGQYWSLGLAPDIPLALRLEGGASKSVLDLAELMVTSLAVKTGASDTRVMLPRAVERCEVRVEAGAAQVSIEVPAGVSARIRSQMGLGTTHVDETRFPRGADGWESPDFATAARRAEIHAAGGVGTVRVS